MLHLLEIPTDYWSRFIIVETTTDTDSQKVSGYSYFGKFVRSFNINRFQQNHFAKLIFSLLSGTPNARIGNTTLRKERKFFPTPPYTANRR